MARLRNTSCLTGSSEWVEKGKLVHPQNNPGDDTCREQHLGTHHVDLSGKPHHISVNNYDNKEESSLSEEESSAKSAKTKTTTMNSMKTTMKMTTETMKMKVMSRKKCFTKFTSKEHLWVNP